ncbi:MAG TPA: DUF6429 family protein [Burkholderiaceae bacterium]|nr:DUF6429 family protein [Burkholderiaceae bacterium]
MEYDDRKIEESILALLGVFEFENGRVWKRYDFSTMDALHAKGLITQPRGRQDSVHLTAEGLTQAKALAARHFGSVGAGEKR